MQKEYPIFANEGERPPPRCVGTVANGGKCTFPGAPMRWKHGQEYGNNNVINPMRACLGCYQGLMKYNAALDEAEKKALEQAAKEAPKGLVRDYEKSKEKKKKRRREGKTKPEIAF